MSRWYCPEEEMSLQAEMLGKFMEEVKLEGWVGEEMEWCDFPC